MQDPLDEGALHMAPETDGSARAPLQLMAQFLRAVSDSRMENALALAQTILTFEPRNIIMLDYQATLAQYINNERELAEEDTSDEGTTSESSSYSEEDDSDTSISEDDSTAESSDDEQKDVNDGDRSVASKTEEQPLASSLEETRLGNMLHSLRQARTSRNQESVSRWDEGNFAASRREVEAILWQFLPGEARQAAKNRAQALSVPGDFPKVPPAGQGNEM